jgi:succinoglycan biosynthesis protein ExoA
MCAEDEPLAQEHLSSPSRSVTVIVPVRNEANSIAHTLEQLLEQRRDGITIEIIVVDGRSTDGTREIVRDFAARYQEVRLLDNPRQLSSAARNAAIQESRGDYIVIIDGHCEFPTRTYFLDLVQAFERSGADCLGRPQPLDVSQASTLQRAIAAARSTWLGHHPDSFIYTGQEVDCPAASVAVAYRRSVFDEVGHFDERFDACEDYELNHRVDIAGLRCRLIPRLTVKYEPRKSLRGLFQQMYRYGRGRVRLFRKHRETISWRTLAPAAFVLGAILGPLMCVAIPVLWPFYLSAMAIYLGVTIIESVRLATVSKDARILPRLPAVFWTIHVGSGCGLLWEMARRN